MSAFMIDDEAWQNIVDALCSPSPYGETVEGRLERDYGDIIKDWYDANDRAVAGRYRHALEGRTIRVKPSKEVKEAREADKYRKVIGTESHVPLVQYIKSIQCLRYQCSEDVSERDKEAHGKAMAEMNEAIRILGERVVQALPEYETASWG